MEISQAEIDAALGDFFKKPQIQADLDEVALDRNEVVQSLQYNAKFFIDFFLHEELAYEIPQFHESTFRLLVALNIYYLALALPRGHAKTTLAKLACVYIFLFTDIRFIVYVSNTLPVAAAAASDIIAFIESENFVSVFGAVKWEKRNESKGTFIFEIMGKRCILKALGYGQQVRGINVDNIRPQMAVCDDIEDDENTATELQQNKLDKWFFGAFLKALSRKPKAKVIFIGNYVANHCLLARLCKDPLWFSIRMGAIKSNGEPLWPDLWPYQALRDDFQNYQRLGQSSLWFSEMMNVVIPDNTGIVDINKINYVPHVLPEYFDGGSFITIDPGHTTYSKNDKGAIAVHGIKDYLPRVVYTESGYYSYDMLFDRAIELAKQYHCSVIGIESDKLQKAMAPLFQLKLQLMGLEDHLTVVPLSGGNAAKYMRLKAFGGAITSKPPIYALTEGLIEVIDEFVNFDPSKQKNEDNVIDACSFGPQMLEVYNQYIYPLLNAEDAVSFTVERELEVSSV